MKYLLAVFLFISFNCLFAQSKYSLTGYVRNQSAEPISGVLVTISNTGVSTQTNKDGYYMLYILNPKSFVSFTRIGFKSIILEIGLNSTSNNSQDIILYPDLRPLDEVKVNVNARNRTNTFGLNAQLVQSLPSASGNFESILKTLPGVSSNNELSSQYSVRGGNFDENLVYVNDVEIYRPLLIRNGQQEGLSFINPELTGQVRFSAGGFEARYGDKLSSVLDVKYLKPDSTSITASLGLLGNSASFKLPFKQSYLLAGIRLKNNQSILNTQDIKGVYTPQFADYQVFYSFNVNDKLSYSIMANHNSSVFSLEPESRETKFGTFNEVLRLQVDYSGKETDSYQTTMAALSLLFKPSPTFNLKWITSGFRINEQERFEIEGRYIFDEIETGLQNPNFGKVRANRGVGSNLDYANNKLTANIYSSELKAYRQFSHSFFESGIRFQYDDLQDRLSEYQVIDSAGYILPVDQETFNLSDQISAVNRVSTGRVTGYLQNSLDLSPKFNLTAGLRANYSSFTNQVLLSPRVTLAYFKQNKNDLLVRVSAGSYNQQPFYREYRRFNGSLNREIKAQRSWHFLTGADYHFDALGTNVKFSSEIYYKYLSNLTPYKIENLRIRYFADQESEGYATGADFSLGGQFVKDLESSFRLSFLKTAENIKDDFYLDKDKAGNSIRIEPGYLKRPSDQRVNFSIFFQDKLLNSPSNKVHLTMLYGSALPVGPPGAARYRDVFKIPAYKRVDIGFSKDFLENKTRKNSGFLVKYFDSLIAYAEIFNLLDINNTVSYLWIKDVNNNQYAVPNYLTSRQFNFRIIANISSN